MRASGIRTLAFPAIDNSSPVPPQRRIAQRNEHRRHRKGAQHPRRAASASLAAAKAQLSKESDFTLSLSETKQPPRRANQ